MSPLRFATCSALLTWTLASGCSLTLPESKLGSGEKDAGPQEHDAGPAATTCGGHGPFVCSSQDYCVLATGSCDEAGDVGTCQPVPDGCADIYSPVCGCDGKTYGNDCEAARQRTNIAFRGPCDGGDGDGDSGDGDVGDGGDGDGDQPGAICGGLAGTPCPLEQYCKFELGAACGAADATGICTLRPDDGCATIYQPVCGCDGKTYGNDCEAATAGVSVARTGTCELQQCSPCPEGPMPQIMLCDDGVHMSGEFCVTLADGTCGWQYVACPDPCGAGAPLKPGECWTDTDCHGGICQGAQCCDPNAECSALNHAGSCAYPGD